jgi:hypothetical protein
MRIWVQSANAIDIFLEKGNAQIEINFFEGGNHA